MNGNNFKIETVEELLRRSKQMQNKIRQELNLQEMESPIHTDTELKKQEQSPPVWDNAMPSPHVNSIVADHLQDESNLSIKSNKKAPNKGAGAKANKQQIPHKSNNGIEVRDSLLSLHRTSVSARTRVAGKSAKKLTTPIASKRKTTSILNASPSSTSKINLESNKLVATSSYRLPLQRFAEPTNKNIDFFKDHPDLELDMTSEQTSLFPRRFQRSSEYLPNNGSCVNVVEAEVKPPHATPVVVKPDTWNGILMQNKPAHKIARLKKTKDIVMESTLNSGPPPPKTKEPDQHYDIISAIPANGIITIEKQSDRLAKQKQCHLQRFPVLYMRPECKVQKAASISIRGESESILKAKTVENSTGNVKYFEYKHGDEGEDGDKIVELEVVPDKVGIDDKEKDNSNKANKIKENKFFKALEFVNPTDYSTTNSASSPFTLQSSSSNRSLSSLSSNSSLKNVRPSKTVNKIRHNLRPSSKNVLPTTITKESVMSPPSRREAHVQTDVKYKETVSTNTSPLPSPIQTPPQPEITASVKINDTINNIAQLHKVENSVEEDIIAKIFERIRNDLPDALAVYKNRNMSTDIGIMITRVPTSLSDKENDQEKKNQKHSNQTSNLNNPSNVKLSSNEIEPRLQSVEEKQQVKDNQSQTISEMIPIDCYPDSPTPISGAHKKFPLLMQTKNQNKPSAGHDAMLDVDRMKQKSQEYPTGAEIQRAVKIFIDSLTLNSSGGEKKVHKNDISTKRRSIALATSEFVTRDNLNRYTSTDSSSTSNSLNRFNNKILRNMKRRGHIVRCDNSRSSTSTGLSSTDLGSDSDDATFDMQSLSLHSVDKNNTSDGEIKSIGEI